MAEKRSRLGHEAVGRVDSALSGKLSSLWSLLHEVSPVLVAYSGGVDSTTLLHAAAMRLGSEAVLAVTASGDVHTDGEAANAIEGAATIGVPHLVISTQELEIPGFSDNPPERCYHCKRSLYGRLMDIARDNGLKTVIDGANADDSHDHRPGLKASRELGVRSPLAEAGLTKEEVRTLAHEWGLTGWDRPSSPCLASRFPYGDRITKEALVMVAEAEAYLHDLGLETVRVRHHGDLARIELVEEEVAHIMEESGVGEGAGESMRRGIVLHLRGLGYRFVTLDLQGFRSGSLNEVLGPFVTGEERR